MRPWCSDGMVCKPRSAKRGVAMAHALALALAPLRLGTQTPRLLERRRSSVPGCSLEALASIVAAASQLEAYDEGGQDAHMCARLGGRVAGWPAGWLPWGSTSSWFAPVWWG